MTELSINHSTFTLERTFDRPPADVFAAWSDPEAKGRWLTGGSAVHSLDFRVGGLERVRAEHDGKQIGWESLYREIVTDRRIVYTSVLSENSEVATVSLTTVEFTPTSDGAATELVLVEHGAYLDGRELPEWRERGTAGQLDALSVQLTAPVPHS